MSLTNEKMSKLKALHRTADCFVSDASRYTLSYVSNKRKNAKVESTSAPKLWTASSADESDASNKRKNANVESSPAPKRRSQRILSQNSDLTVATSQLRLSSSLSSSYDLNNLASGFEVNTGANSDTGSISDTDTNIKNINEASEKEKNWWSSKRSLGSLGVDEER
jgi:hypothetical protein